MYGLILEGISNAIRKRFGEEVWTEVWKKAGVTHHTFVMHKTYSETVAPRIVKAASDVTGRPIDEIFELCGLVFVSFVSQYGYDRVMRVLGRHLRDFLNGLDNLHEYLRFSYPKLKPPSFFCENESRHGLTLHYRSKRKGFVYYVMGQITQVAKAFYNTPVEIELISEEETLDMTHVILKLHFDNLAFKDNSVKSERSTDGLNISSELFFDVFPFHIVFNRAMIIKSIGSGLHEVMKHVSNQAIDEMFFLNRPMVEFSMENVLMHTNNVFEMTSIDTVQRVRATRDDTTLGTTEADEEDSDDLRKRLKLKGQMLFMQEWDAVVFLGTPIMEDLDKMFETGLYINDLSMHDSSRDLVLAGTQQQAELKMALDQEQQKSKKLQESMKQLDQEMKRTDGLLYQMIPKAVADRLRRGDPSMTTCQIFENVSILISDIVGFTGICSKITPMQVVSMLNGVYTSFDKLSETHRVYKVETIGDAYMVVSGAPIITKYHAVYVSEMSLDMMQAVKNMPDPSQVGGKHIHIRIGVHTGQVVAGVVGMKMPRYCFFGETVNITNLMESTGESMKVHISDKTCRELKNYPFEILEADAISITAEVSMKSHWLVGKTREAPIEGRIHVDEKADLEGNASGFITIDGEEPDVSHMYQPIVQGGVSSS